MRYFDQKGKVKGSGGVTTDQGRRKLYSKLTADDIVALEACSLAFVMEREMRSIGCQVIILHPAALAVIYASVKKTDKEMRQCKIVREAQELTKDRTWEINRLHALFLQCGITDIVKKDLSTDAQRKAVLKRLTGYEAEQAQRLCRQLEKLEEQTVELYEKRKRECEEDKNIELAKTIPGVGDKTALAFCAYVGLFNQASKILSA